MASIVGHLINRNFIVCYFIPKLNINHDINHEAFSLKLLHCREGCLNLPEMSYKIEAATLKGNGN